ncbi:MAG TPA: TIGR01459 family HAD-type hydrolase [Bradyrhizobium sp.]
MASEPRLLEHFSDIAPEYDALICDVWGVLHNGAEVFAPACETLQRFRQKHGRVVLLSNAPRPSNNLVEQFKRFGVPADCYDAIVTSGDAARRDLAYRAAKGPLSMLHLGPERDRDVYEGLNVDLADVDKAGIVLCTGLFDDDHETPDDYTDMLATMKARDLLMLCANPDRVVQRGGVLVHCAGALANAYEELGGKVVYYGKPRPAIYDAVRKATGNAKKPLAIGDGLHTDVRGANGVGIDALFIADGIHGEDVEEFTASHMAALFDKAGVSARAAMRALVW